MEQFEKTVYHHFSAGAGGSSLILSVFDGESEPYQADLRAFGKQKVTFGRSEENDIVLRSKLVSRRHGEFFIHGDACVLLDSGSTNGLTVNGARVREHALQEGDHIRIDDLASPSQLGVLLLFATAPETLAWQSCPVREQQEITIGRDPSCDIQLPHVSVSRLHASILREGNEFFIVDRGSTNGLTVNGAPVRQKQLLRERDVILITNSKLVFSRNVIRYCCYTGGIGVDASHIVKRVPAKDGEKTISNDISLSIKPCELVAIIGGSGAGKTTFMNCLSGSVPATEGHVYVNGEDLYANYGTLKSVIGYVPQQDIVYGELSLWDMLEYAAKLRMPVDTSPAERAARIHSVIGTVELTGNEGTLIRQLSGGQRKRASIAVELLSDPGLFFLDEPTSGLDPGIERSLMKTLRGMSRQGKTIVLVTHNIQNLHLCDQVIILGYGGVLCYCGAPDEALRFFGTDNLVDVYNMVSAQPEDWRGRFAAAAAAPAAQMPAAAPARAGGGRGERRPFFYQLGVLCARYLRLIGNDRQKLLILLLQAPLLAALIALVANGTQFEQYETTKSLLFALACAAFWVGILNAIQEICKERPILRREYLAGLRLSAYMGSKLLVLGALCLLQSALLAGMFGLAVGLPAEGLLLPPILEMWITTFLTAFSAAATGLFVSALFKSADRVMTVAPLLLIPQLLFSGLIFELTDVTEAISNIIPCRWAMEGYGSAANLNELPYKLMEQGVPLVHEAEKYFTYTAEHLLHSWGILLLYAAVLSALGMAALHRNAGSEVSAF